MSTEFHNKFSFDLSFENCYLNVLFSSFDLVPKDASDFYKPSFIGSVYESHIVMAQVCYVVDYNKMMSLSFSM